MKWSSEYREQIKGRVKLVLVRKPSASKYELARILDIDKDTALRLKKEIHQESLAKADSQKLFEELGKLESLYDELVLECWKIINEDAKVVKNSKGKEVFMNVTVRQKISAMRTIMSSSRTLFYTKLDAGIFQRKLGESKPEKELSEEQKKLLEQALKEAKP